METVFFGKSIKGIAWLRSQEHFLLNLLRNIFGAMLYFHVSYKNTCQMCLYVFEKCKTKLAMIHYMGLYDTRFEIFFKRMFVLNSHRNINRTEFKRYCLIQNL